MTALFILSIVFLGLLFVREVKTLVKLSRDKNFFVFITVFVIVLAVYVLPIITLSLLFAK